MALIHLTGRAYMQKDGLNPNNTAWRNKKQCLAVAHLLLK